MPFAYATRVRRLLTLAGAAWLASAALGGCGLVLGLGDLRGEEGGAGATQSSSGTGAGGTGTGGTGAGGTGGTTSSSASSGGGTGGMCATMSCTTPADCPKTPNECVANTCAQGCCGTTHLAMGTKTVGGQTSGDCHAVECDGMGLSANVLAVDDPPIAMDACHIGGCDITGIPMQEPAQAGAPCGFSNGKVCDGSGACVACLVGADCTAPAVCDAAAHLCVAPTCVDAQKDGTETDVDCGGGACAPCILGKMCNGASDCASGTCAGNTCVTKANGAPCASGVECASTFCADNVCCASACGSATGCASCDLPGAIGTCTNVLAGSALAKTTCATQGQASCGLDGTCDGAGACQHWPASSSCRFGPVCSAGLLTSTGSCDGRGACIAGPAVACADGFACADAMACNTTCSGNADCAAGKTCCGTTCVDVTNDPAHCGMCGVACSVGGTCAASACKCNGGTDCAAGSACCGAEGCKDITSDPDNCGMCSHACSFGEICASSVCACGGGASCAAGMTCCGAAGCVNIGTDPAHCGGCGNACPVGDSCSLSGCSDWANWPMPNPPSTGLPHPASYDFSVPGVAKDNVTGLWWQRTLDVPNDLGLSYAVTGCSQPDAVAYCANLTQGGKNDWRLPTRIELISIVDYSRQSPALDPSAFPNNLSFSYWTSSPFGGGVWWNIRFQDGGSYLDPPQILAHVQCVRGLF